MFASHAEIVAAIGTNVLAHELGRSKSAVASWRTRDSIPGRYFKPVADVARALGIELTIGELATLAALPCDPDVHPDAAPASASAALTDVARSPAVPDAVPSRPTPAKDV